MKKMLLAAMATFLSCCTNGNMSTQSTESMSTQSKESMITLYPKEAFATKYGQTIKFPDLSGLPIFSATYDSNQNKVIVRNGDKRLTLFPSHDNIYYKSGNQGSLEYSMEATVYDGLVSTIKYIETEDNITYTVEYSVK